MSNEKMNEDAATTFHRFVRSLNEIESKEKIDDDDILKLASLLNDYAKHPDSTEDRRINASKELDRIRAMYLSKNKS